jgi:hypothetical protein
MENDNSSDRKTHSLTCGLAYILLTAQILPAIYAGQPQLPDDFRVREYFSFFGSGGIDWQALNDPNNNPILVACLKGVADESLKPPGILDVRQRLERLERGGLIKKADGRYALAFPAVVGAKRDQLQKYAEQTALQLVPFGEKMITQIRLHLAGRDEMVYHVLWSVIMDGGRAWDSARAEMNKRIDAGDTSTENKAWVLYPSHPFRVGTNGYNTAHGHLAITWSRNTPRPDVIGRILSQHISQLAQAIEQNAAITSAGAKDALSAHGLTDEAGKVRLYAMKPDSQAAQSYAELGTQFGQQMMAHLDVNEVVKMLEVSPGIAFVIAYHEICWQLLQDLAEKKVLSIPPIVAQAGTKTSDAYQLVSLTIIRSVNSPLPETEMSKEEAQAIEEFRRIKARILAGESYTDVSTPLHAALTQFSSWKPQDRGYFTGLDILRAPLPPAQPEEGSLWPVFAGEKELEDTFVLVFSKGQWIWIGNVGTSYDWRLARSAFEKWAREKIGPSAPAAGLGSPPAKDVQPPGKPTGNRVLSLDGRRDSMRVADSQSLHSFSEAITIEVWLKAASFYPEDWAISSLIRKNVAEGAENFLLRFRNMNGRLCAQMGLGEIGTLSAPSEFGLNKWYHLAGTYDGRTITVLVDGLAVANQNASGRLRIDPSDLYIGKGDPEYLHEECFHGQLDEIRIWNVARSQEQIQAAMNTSLSGKEEGLLAYWNFDDGAAKDLSGHGNNGVLDADAKVVESSRSASVAAGQDQVNKLIAWWRLDEADGNDVADSSGNGHAGRLVGNPRWQPAGGKVAGALAFDGAGDFVQIGDEPAFDLAGPLTMSAWIKVNSFDKRWQALVTKGDTAWRLQRTAEENTLAFHCTGITAISGRWSQGIEGKKNVNDGQWHHVVGVYDGSTIRLYIDGAPDNSSEASGAIQMNDLAVTIGGNSEQAGREWNGLIDEVCIIGGALDANAVRALYTGTNPTKVAQTATTAAPVQTGPGRGKLVAWWKFENDANDSAGANHGTLHGNPTYVDGKVGRAISFDANDYVDCGKPDSLNFGTGDWTISAWIKTTQSGTEPANRGTVFANGGDEAGGIRYALAVNEEYLGTIVLTTDNDMYKVQAFGKTAVNNGNWHHVIGTRNADRLRVYVDGTLDGDASLPSGYDLSGVSQHNAYIGAITDHRDNSLFKYFVGLIDEVCIFGGAIDANGVRSLYAGGDPAKVAQKAILARAAPQPPPPPVTGAVARGSIEGDWEIVSSQVGQKAVIPIRRNSDGALTATIVFESTDVAAPTIPLDEVTFENDKLHFKGGSPRGVFEGTMKEDGLTIEGQFQQQGQTMALALRRVVAAVSEPAPASAEQLQGQTSGTSRIATALILVLVLAGVVAAVVFFLVRSSIRT